MASVSQAPVFQSLEVEDVVINESFDNEVADPFVNNSSEFVEADDAAAAFIPDMFEVA